MIEGYAYALKIDGVEIKPWFTGKDGALRDVNLERFVDRWAADYGPVQSAQIIDQRISKIVVRWPHRRFYPGA